MIKVNGIEVQQSNFPDKTLLLKMSDTILQNCDDTGYINVHWLYENDAELFTLICVKRYLDENFYHKAIHLVMPYIPHARMDRVKNSEDVFTLKYFCEIINSLHFVTVEVRDAHSNVSLALLNNVYEEPIEDYVRDAINQSGAEALFFPDEGAMKRYAGLFKDMPYAFGMKKRDWKTGQIQGLDLVNPENIVDKKVLIVDDICSRGGTFYHSAKALHKAGAAEVNLYITHCEDTIHQGDLREKGLINQIYTTDSILRWTFWIDKINILD
jgi:ribose-phosphate pyrophosphokinase